MIECTRECICMRPYQRKIRSISFVFHNLNLQVISHVLSLLNTTEIPVDLKSLILLPKNKTVDRRM